MIPPISWGRRGHAGPNHNIRPLTCEKDEDDAETQSTSR